MADTTWRKDCSDRKRQCPLVYCLYGRCDLRSDYSTYLAGLQSVPAELYEAAKVEGANAIHRFPNVTIPMLAPAITICVVGITTGSLKVYDLLVTSTKGGPG